MTDLEQAARLALDALEEVFDRGQCELTYLQGKRAIAALRAALAQQAEPVAEPVPLTVAEIEQMNAQWDYEIHGDRTRYLVRMTEKAHGIGEKE